MGDFNNIKHEDFYDEVLDHQEKWYVQKVVKRKQRGFDFLGLNDDAAYEDKNIQYSSKALKSDFKKFQREQKELNNH